MSIPGPTSTRWASCSTNCSPARCPSTFANLQNAGFDEIRRRIRDVRPSRPSERVSELGDRAAELARSRRSDSSTLSRRAFRRPRPDHDEGAGEGPGAALRLPRRVRRGHRPPPLRRAGAGAGAERPLSPAQDDREAPADGGPAGGDPGHVGGLERLAGGPLRSIAGESRAGAGGGDDGDPGLRLSRRRLRGLGPWRGARQQRHGAGVARWRRRANRQGTHRPARGAGDADEHDGPRLPQPGPLRGIRRPAERCAGSPQDPAGKRRRRGIGEPQRTGAHPDRPGPLRRGRGGGAGGDRKPRAYLRRRRPGDSRRHGDAAVDPLAPPRARRGVGPGSADPGDPRVAAR